MRAILKTADFCAADPERAAQRLVDGGFTKRYDYALQTLTELPYDRWREFDPEDTMRFFALRLHEVGHDQVEPERAPRRRHRLALPERAQARAEGVSHVAGEYRLVAGAVEKRVLRACLMQSEDYRVSARQRKIIETGFADMKRNRGLTRLRLRGLTGANDELLLAATVQNLRRLAKAIWPSPVSRQLHPRRRDGRGGARAASASSSLTRKTTSLT